MIAKRHSLVGRWGYNLWSVLQGTCKVILSALIKDVALILQEHDIASAAIKQSILFIRCSRLWDHLLLIGLSFIEHWVGLIVFSGPVRTTGGHLVETSYHRPVLGGSLVLFLSTVFQKLCQLAARRWYIDLGALRYVFIYMVLETDWLADVDLYTKWLGLLSHCNALVYNVVPAEQYFVLTVEKRYSIWSKFGFATFFQKLVDCEDRSTISVEEMDWSLRQVMDSLDFFRDLAKNILSILKRVGQV